MDVECQLTFQASLFIYVVATWERKNKQVQDPSGVLLESAICSCLILTTISVQQRDTTPISARCRGTGSDTVFYTVQCSLHIAAECRTRPVRLKYIFHYIYNLREQNEMYMYWDAIFDHSSEKYWNVLVTNPAVCCLKANCSSVIFYSVWSHDPLIKSPTLRLLCCADVLLSFLGHTGTRRMFTQLHNAYLCSHKSTINSSRSNDLYQKILLTDFLLFVTTIICLRLPHIR